MTRPRDKDWHEYNVVNLHDNVARYPDPLERTQTPRRLPLKSDALFWLVPPRQRAKQALIDCIAIAAACIFIMTGAVAVTAALFIMLFMKS